MSNTIYLAYSGGLDSTLIIKLLQLHYDFSSIIPVLFNFGQSNNEIRKAKKNAEKIGTPVTEINAREAFFSEWITWVIMANGSYDGYPLGTALSRLFIANHLGEMCRENNVRFISHGCSGKGNDNKRFDRIFRTKFPEIKIIKPVIELNLTRGKERELAEEYNLEYEKGFSHDVNFWNHSIGSGEVTKIGEPVPREKYYWTGNPLQTDVPYIVEIEFSSGVPIRINGMTDMIKGINQLNIRCGEYGIGQHENIEHMISGMKSYEVYEFPGADVLLKAHRFLEKLILTKDELEFKRHIDHEFSRLSYCGAWFDPLMDSIKAFLKDNQKRVNGKITVSINVWGIKVVDVQSSDLLYSPEKRSLEFLSENTQEG